MNWLWATNTTTAGPSTTTATINAAWSVSLRFHTWREAILVACAAATRYTVRGKPKVRRDASGRWVVTYRETPLAINT